MFLWCCCDKSAEGGMDSVHTMPAIQDSETKEPEDIVENTLEMNETSGSFTVQVKLPEMYLCHLGLELDDVDSRGPMIVSIGTGVVDNFNKENPKKSLKAYDCITSVDGKFGEMRVLVDALKDGMQKADRTMHLTVARPTPFKIILEKSELKLGAQLNYKASSQGISLAQIAHGGRFERWNALNPDVPVKAGDRIIEIGGAKLSGGKMLQELKKQDTDLVLTLLRY
eukprot:Skav226958  [mRNA]  locus=scaffold51:86104:106451:- [translate_table: standard]